MAETTCWGVIVDAMKNELIKHVFGIPSDGVHLYQDLADYPEIKPILVRHETSAVLMAMGFSRVTNDPAVCYASPGPGVANLVPGLLEAYSACSPIVALGSSTKMETDQMGGFQENDQIAMVHGVTKWAYRLSLPQKAGWAMNRAFTVATNGRPGPVYVISLVVAVLRRAICNVSNRFAFSALGGGVGR